MHWSLGFCIPQPTGFPSGNSFGFGLEHRNPGLREISGLEGTDNSVPPKAWWNMYTINRYLILEWSPICVRSIIATADIMLAKHNGHGVLSVGCWDGDTVGRGENPVSSHQGARTSHPLTCHRAGGGFNVECHDPWVLAVLGESHITTTDNNCAYLTTVAAPPTILRTAFPSIPHVQSTVQQGKGGSFPNMPQKSLPFKRGII